MSVSARVRSDEDVEHFNGYLIANVGGKYRVYEDGSYYSQTSGGVTVRGKGVRRYDPEAGSAEGKIATFDTIAEAEQYITRWLTP